MWLVLDVLVLTVPSPCKHSRGVPIPTRYDREDPLQSSHPPDPQQHARVQHEQHRFVRLHRALPDRWPLPLRSRLMSLLLILCVLLAAWVVNPSGPFVIFAMLSSWCDDIKVARAAKKEKKEE